MQKVDRMTQWLQRRCGGHHIGGIWRLRQYVRDYLLRCVIGNLPVDLVTLWCLTKSVEDRWNQSQGKLEPTTKELKTASEIKTIVEFFGNERLEVNWFIFMAKSAVASGQIEDCVREAYGKMMETLLIDVPSAAIDLIPSVEPAFEALSKVPEEALERERMRRTRLYEKRRISASPETIEADLRRSIATKAAEGLWLVKTFSDGLLLVPVEYPERYDFHNLLLPTDLPRVTEKICPVLTPYPWRNQ